MFKIKKNCENCGKDYTVNKFNKRQRFCCKACSGQWRYNNPKHPHKTCLRCGKAYRPKSIERNKYCSRECYHQSMKAKPKPKITYHKYCSICKGEFKATPRCRVYCSDKCLKEKNRKRWYENARNNYEPPTYTCQECGKEFSPEYGSKRRVFCSNRCAKRKSSRISKAIRRARKRGNGYESVDPLMILDRDKWKCQNCNIKAPKILRGTIEDNAPEVDHIIPLAAGGKHVAYNMQCLCRKCNQMKGDTIEGQLLLFAGVEHNG